MNHHYVPAFYLAGFTDPNTPTNQTPYVWLVDLEETRIRRRSPDNAAGLTDYYAVGEGDDRYAVEEYFSRLETAAAPIFSRIVNQHFSEGAEFLHDDDKAWLSRFVAAQIVRVPSFRTGVENFVTNIGQALGGLMTRSREDFELNLRNSHPDREFTAAEISQQYEDAVAAVPQIRANPTAALGHALSPIPKIAELLQRMSWAIMTPSTNQNFWTSDNPVYLINPDSSDPVIGHGLAAQGTELTFPLGPQRCLLLNWSGREGMFFVSDLAITRERTIFAATRYLFCSSEGDAQEALATYRRLHPSRR